MPKRNDIKKVMIIGSGPIVIGQACEFDYSGTQACKALRGLGYQIVLVNSNPATIMTDPGMADVTYIEPLNLQRMTEIIEKERPDALLPNLGGQTGLNLSSELAKAGVLEKYGVKVIGVEVDAIERGEDRVAFKETMKKLGIDMPKSELAYSGRGGREDRGRAGLSRWSSGRPTRWAAPAAAWSTTSRSCAPSPAAASPPASSARSSSRKSVLGWEELELEVVRDAKNQMITVCFIENVDAMGVHTGDSFCAAPMLTIAPELQAEAAEVLLRHRRGHRGHRRHQHPVRPRPQDRPRGRHRDQPAHLALLGPGLQGHRLPHRARLRQAGRRPDAGRDPLLARRHAGEVHALGRLRGRQVRPLGLREVQGRRGQARHADARRRRGDEHRQELQGGLPEGDPLAGERPPRPGLRQGLQPQAAGRAAGHAGRAHQRAAVHHVRGAAQGRRRRGALRADLHQALVHPADEGAGRAGRGDPQAQGQARCPTSCSTQAKKDGFADKYLAKLLGVPEKTIREQRKALGVVEGWDAVPVSGVENAAYYYSTYNAPDTRARQQPQEGHGPGRRPQPHRPGHRVRLLLRPRGLRPARRRATRRSWSTATPRPSPPTTTPPTSSTSSR